MCDHIATGMSRLVPNGIVPITVCESCNTEIKIWDIVPYKCDPKLGILLQPEGK